MHRVEDQLEAMSGAVVFKTLDLTKGYHQMKLAEASKEITAFTSPQGLYQWQVLPMGMKTSGAVFQRLMDQMLGKLQPKCAVVYIYDITIFSPNMKQHLVDLESVFKRIQEANLKLNFDKCKFALPEVKVLGHMVSKKGIRPDPKKTEIIQNLPAPKDVTGVKSIMGVINYFRKFIPNCSILAEPLLILTRGKKRLKSNFVWGDDQQASFEALKECLINAPILKFPNFEKEFCIETDASLVGLGAVLSQSQDDYGFENRFPVAYASQLLSEAERNYGITNLEGLAVSWAISHFETYIHRMHFTVITDHSALKTFLKINLF